MGWTTNQKLFILFEDGQYIIISASGELLSNNKLFEASLTDIVFHACSCDDGFIAYTKNNHVYIHIHRKSLNSQIVRRLPSRPADQDIVPGSPFGRGEPRGMFLRIRIELQRVARRRGAGVLHGPIALLHHMRLGQRDQHRGTFPRFFACRVACRGR